MLEQMDFLSMGTQTRIYKILMKVARHSSSETDVDSYLMPIMPFLAMGLSPDMGADSKKIEDLSKVVCEV